MTNPCNDISKLAKYIEGRLSPHEKSEMEIHLMSCDACLEEYISAKLLLTDPELMNYELAPAPLVNVGAILESIKAKADGLIRWLENLVPPTWMLNYAASPVRSGSSDRLPAIFIKKNLGDLNAELYFEQKSRDQMAMSIKVFRDSQPVKNVSLTIKKEGSRPKARFLNREYERMDKLDFGRYTLTFESPGVKKNNILFKIDERGFHDET